MDLMQRLAPKRTRAMIKRRIQDLRNARAPAHRGERYTLEVWLSHPLMAPGRAAKDAHTRARVAATMGDVDVATYWRARRDTILMLAAMVGVE